MMRLSFRFFFGVVGHHVWSRRGCWALSSSFATSSSQQEFRSLSKICYHDISEQSNNLVPKWPDSKQLCDHCLVYQEETQSYRLPTFPDGNGPLGVFAFLHDNPNARAIMTQCDIVFNDFCEIICHDILKEKNSKQSSDMMEHWVLSSPPTSHHISVAILQEHPSFLRDHPEDLAKWQPLTNSTIQDLISKFEQAHYCLSDDCWLPPQLTLDTLLWTPDGALIAGFVDHDEDGDNTSASASVSGRIRFDDLRQSTRSVAKELLGDLLTATRPKNLIHATVGRIVGLPPGSSSRAHHEALGELVRHYNQYVLPATVQNIHASSSCGGTFDLQELSLARNTRWMLHEYIEYGRWKVSSKH